MSFSAIVEAETLTDALAPVEALVGECKLRTRETGIQITAVDAANVGMVDMEIDASAFASYEAEAGVLGLNLDRLVEILGMADSGEMVELELDEETRKLAIQIGGLSFTMALIDPESIREEPDIPELDLDATFVFEGSALSRAVTAADLVSDHIKMVGMETEVRFEASGDTDDVEVVLGDDELESAIHEGGDRVASLFSLEYLNDMESPIGSDGALSLLIGNEMPCKLRYSSADGDVSVTNMLAPRIQSG